MKVAKLSPVELPDFGDPVFEPTIPRQVYEARLARLQRRMRDLGFDAVAIYGDREHCANIMWATGYDPRFEEAICLVMQSGKPVLYAGNEGLPYSEVAAGCFHRVLWQPLSLMGQSRQKYRDLASLFKEAGLRDGMQIGIAGWKGFESETGVFNPDWFETPHYLVETLKSFGTVTNAAQLFMHPGHGLRAINEVEQLACFEYAATRTSSAIRRFIRNIRPGMTEYEAVTAMRLDGFPQSVHINMSSGPRARFGLPSPSSRVMQLGDPVVVGFGLMGALNCRAGFLVHDATELPEGIQDYASKLAGPLFRAAAAWYRTAGIGIPGADLYNAVMNRIGDPFFGVTLNPGHQIHLDEWMNTPIRANSITELASGMAFQCDIIPATGTDYFTSNIEDGIAIADKSLRADFESMYPEAWGRIMTRRTFMKEKLGIDLKPEILPFSNIPAWLPPFWLDPGQVFTHTD